jgi:uncharacterized protein
MELTGFEKLALTLLCEMHDAHGIKDGLDAKFIQRAIADDQTWAISERYGGIIFRAEFLRPPHVSKVIQIMQMCEVIEDSYDKLSNEEKARVDEQTKHRQAFPSFDADSEKEYFLAAKFLIEQMGMFQRFSRDDINSHSPSLSHYSRMDIVFAPLRDRVKYRRIPNLTAEEIISIINA